MNAKSKHSLKALTEQRAKDTKKQDYKAQMDRVYKAFNKKPKTMLQASKEADVRRANICRYVAKWRKADKIGVAKYGICPVSKHRAGFYTTNRALFIKPKNKNKNGQW